jgi:hypothetical protein
MIIKARDLYTQSQSVALISDNLTIGQTIIQYEVRRYVDTRNLAKVNSFVITCTQRLVIPNSDPFVPKGEQIAGYIGYPGMFTNTVQIVDNNAIIDGLTLIDYSPKTLNTSVTSNQSSGTTNNATSSQQYSSGSSTAQTNSYGTSISLGLSGGMSLSNLGFSESGSASQDSSAAQETTSGTTSGLAIDNGAQYSSASSMALKDWGGYAQIDNLNTIPTWVWGQEYPWNVIQLHNEDNNQNVILPDYVINRLYDGTQVYPPSELSQFGVSFVSKASWLVTPKSGLAGSETISFSHSLTYCVATHQLLDGALTASIDTYAPIVYTADSLDLPVLALDPIGMSNGPALIGFVPNQFDVAPAAGADFAITAESNLMLVRGSGFADVMTTDFSDGPVQMTLYFKLLESSRNISLSLKHWVSNGGTCEVAIQINGTTSITKYVNAPEAGSGGDNVLVLPLRCKDFTSVDYCDFLQFGLNTVTLTFTSTSDPVAAYTLQAMAVG